MANIMGFFFRIRARMRTTNRSESLNAEAWRRTPKHLLVTKNTVSTTVLEYNKGANGLSDVFNMLECWISGMDIPSTTCRCPVSLVYALRITLLV